MFLFQHHSQDSSQSVSLHIHLNDETENLLCAEVLHKVDDPFYLINTSRGKIINEKDVVEKLEDGLIKGYATDVLATELDNIKESLIWNYAKNHKNVIITPHIAGATYDAMHSCEEYIVEIVINKINHV